MCLGGMWTPLWGRRGSTSLLDISGRGSRRSTRSSRPYLRSLPWGWRCHLFLYLMTLVHEIDWYIFGLEELELSRVSVKRLNSIPSCPFGKAILSPQSYILWMYISPSILDSGTGVRGNDATFLLEAGPATMFLGTLQISPMLLYTALQLLFRPLSSSSIHFVCSRFWKLQSLFSCWIQC